MIVSEFKPLPLRVCKILIEDRQIPSAFFFFFQGKAFLLKHAPLKRQLKWT